MTEVHRRPSLQGARYLRHHCNAALLHMGPCLHALESGDVQLIALTECLEKQLFTALRSAFMKCEVLKGNQACLLYRTRGNSPHCSV